MEISTIVEVVEVAMLSTLVRVATIMDTIAIVQGYHSVL